MRHTIAFASLLSSLLFSTVYGQEAVKPRLLTGEVSAVNSSKIVLQTKDGSVDVMLTDKTEYKRVSAENPRLKTTTAAHLSDISVGDKLIASGILSVDKKSLSARSVYLMTKADIAERHAKETEEWRTRGITGRVVSVNAPAKQINISVGGLAGTTNVTVTAKENAKFRRYAAGSVKFSEAKESSLGEIGAGDGFRAIGEKSSDGASFTAEQILTGAFQTVGGTVKSIDPAKNEVVITDFQSKKDITIAVSPSTTLKKFPAEIAERMALFQAGGMQPGKQGGAQPPVQEGQGRVGFDGQRGGNFDEMLERFPNITVADLKPGDMIAASSTRTVATDRITAIKLLAGIEPFVRMQAAAPGNQRGTAGGQNFNIPGLDGIDIP